MGFLANRRNGIVENTLRRLIASQVQEAEVNGLFFEAAARYATDNGATIYDDSRDSVMFDRRFDGENYNIFFMKMNGGGTSVAIRRQVAPEEILADEAARLHNSFDQPSKPRFPSWADDRDISKKFINSALRATFDGGVPVAFLEIYTSDDDAMSDFFAEIASVESCGGTLDQQKAAAIMVFTNKWLRLPINERASLLASDAQNIKDAENGAAL